MGGSAARLKAFTDSVKRDDDEQFDIIAHSQGGVVSLFAATDGSFAKRIHSIVTIESPVRGIDTVRFLGSGLFTCAAPTDEAVLDMYPHNPQVPNEVIEQIGARNWATNANPFIITIGNTKDPVISDALPADGVRGVLDKAHEQVLQDLGGDLFTAHGLPLNIVSNSSAGPVSDKLLRALAEYQLQKLFLTGNTYLRPALSRAAITTADTFTRTFIGNDNARQHSGLTPAPIEPKFLTRTFIGNDSARQHSGLTRAPVEPKSLTRTFIGNDSARQHSGLARAPVEPKSLSRVFLGNANVSAEVPLVAPKPPRLKEDVNEDGFVNLLDLHLVVANFGPPPFNPARADLNNDGVVDILDLASVARSIGK